MAMVAVSVGELLGAFIGSIGILPLWYGTMAALLCHIVGFLVYAMATSGWMMIVARVLSGMFIGLQSVLSLAYFGVSYQHYLEVLGPEDRTKEEEKTTRVKDILFVFYAISANVGTLIGPGLIHVTCCFSSYLVQLFCMMLSFLQFHNRGFSGLCPSFRFSPSMFNINTYMLGDIANLILVPYCVC